MGKWFLLILFVIREKTNSLQINYNIRQLFINKFDKLVKNIILGF